MFLIILCVPLLQSSKVNRTYPKSLNASFKVKDQLPDLQIVPIKTRFPCSEKLFAFSYFPYSEAFSTSPECICWMCKAVAQLMLPIQTTCWITPKNNPDPQNMQESATESRLMSTSIKEKLHQQQLGTRHWYQTVNDSHLWKQIY